MTAQSFSQLINQTEKLSVLLKRLPVVINIVLIIACAQLLSEVTWMLLNDSSGHPSTLVAPNNASTNKKNLQLKKSQQQSFRQLSSAHLFGIADKQSTAINAGNAPETKLNLVLRGVLAASPMAKASAIIALSKNGKEETYGINDRIPGGVTLKEIHPEHVILDRQGQLETLRLSKSKGAVLISSSKKSSPTMSSQSSKKLKQIRSELIKNPALFRKYALPVVIKENGKQIGYRLQAQQNSDLLIQAGLESSDVITSVNGIKLNDMKNSISALSALRSANQVSIIVKRNGVEVPLNIQLQ